MFYYLRGTVAHVEPYLAVIDCNGVGYACRTTSYTLSALKKGEKGKLFTYLSIRQDGVDLFGFATQEELNLFQQLTSVSGVGPKAALSILSASTPANLALSIITGDEKALTVAQGIGKKNRPAHHPGAEGQAGQGPDRLDPGGELRRFRHYRHPGEQAVRGLRRPGGAGLLPGGDQPGPEGRRPGRPHSGAGHQRGLEEDDEGIKFHLETQENGSV